jgi:hypothetical protein
MLKILGMLIGSAVTALLFLHRLTPAEWSLGVVLSWLLFTIGLSTYADLPEFVNREPAQWKDYVRCLLCSMVLYVAVGALVYALYLGYWRRFLEVT